MKTPCMNDYQSEVAVFVGTQTCNISSLDDTNLYCKPPNIAPDGETQAQVTVSWFDTRFFQSTYDFKMCTSNVYRID